MGPYQRDPNTTCVNLKGTLLAIGTSLIFSLCMHWVGWELSANVVVRVRVGWSEVGSIGIGGVLAVGCVRESIIRYAIVEHLNKHSLIIDSQHGFRQGRSCLTNLLKFLEELSSYINKGYPVDVIYLDFSKAFNV